MNKICENNSDDKGSSQCAYGNILRFATIGYKEACDTHRYSDNMRIEIKDALEAKDVNWDENLTPLKDSRYEVNKYDETIITTFEMEVAVNNISDEDIKVSITEFYVNDKKVSDEYLAASKDLNIEAHEQENVYNFSGPYVWLSTGESDIDKFGFRVVIKDSNENVVYNDIKWLILE